MGAVWAETQSGNTPPAGVGQPSSRDTQNSSSPRGSTATNVYTAPPLDPSGGGSEVDSPPPHLSSVPAGPATPTTDPAAAQTAKDEILALTDTASANGRFSDAPAGNETSPGTGSVSDENNLSAAANSIQYLGNPVDGVADASATNATEGGFIALDDGTSAVTQLATNGNAPSRADLGNIDSGLSGHKAAGQTAGDWKSGGKSFVSDAYAPAMRHAASQPSLDATEGGAIDLTDAAPDGAASEMADANDGKPGQAATDTGSESGIALFCDMEVAVGTPASDESPAPVLPIGNGNVPATAQTQRMEQNIKPAKESAHRIDPRQRVSVGN